MLLVGQDCVRCAERIANELDARFCRVCNSPVHDRCAHPNGEAGCQACGTAVPTHSPKPWDTRGGEAQPSPQAALAPGNWVRGIRGLVLRGLGALIMVAGGFLILGNQIGFFPTFPFAGTLTLFLGAGIYAVGGGKG
jgi:hypothetical protein